LLLFSAREPATLAYLLQKDADLDIKNEKNQGLSDVFSKKEKMFEIVASFTLIKDPQLATQEFDKILPPNLVDLVLSYTFGDDNMRDIQESRKTSSAKQLTPATITKNTAQKPEGLKLDEKAGLNK
jgi:hypothetical protein